MATRFLKIQQVTWELNDRATQSENEPTARVILTAKTTGIGCIQCYSRTSFDTDVP